MRAAARVGRPRVSAFRRREWLTGYLFVLPATLIIGLFGIFPIGYAIYMSLHRWRIRKGAFIGLANYTDVLGDWWGALAFFGGLLLVLAAHWLWADAFRRDEGTVPLVGRLLGALVLLGSGVAVSLGWRLMTAEGDRRFLAGLTRTVYYGFGSVPVQIVLALVIATLLFQNLRGQE